MIRPVDAEIEEIIAQLECGWIQARNHAIQRARLREQRERDRRKAISDGIRNLA